MWRLCAPDRQATSLQIARPLAVVRYADASGSGDCKVGKVDDWLAGFSLWSEAGLNPVIV